MILEVAVLQIKDGKSGEFDRVFKKAAHSIETAKGYISHQLKKCIEIENQYILLVNWETIKDHEEGFRESPAYQQWKKLLHHFYKPFPIVFHYH